MKIRAYSRYDWLLQLIILPLYVGLLNWISIGSAYVHYWPTFGVASLLTLMVSFQNWYVNNHIALRINEKYTDPKRYVERAIRRFAYTCISSIMHATLLFGLYYFINLPHFEPSSIRYCLALLYTAAIVAIVVITYESMDSFGHWQKSQLEVESLNKAQLQAELNALRQQVNPHFLFNSLNSLISLIEENPQKAGEFAEELSTVYRYLLRSNENTLVSLTQELEFIQSYYHLLKTRHGQGLDLQIIVDEAVKTHQIPSLTLQLLIENAVKHNIALPEQPLTISLASNPQKQLVISNNLQKKNVRSLSNGVGLSNILTKYQMIGVALPIIEDTGREFRVILPLLQPA